MPVCSGLLRMSDLVSMQPNIKIDLFMMAADERREKVAYEINRPTFARLKPPLPRICRFIPYSELKREIEQIGSRIRYMKPEFIGEIAESSLAGGGVSADGAAVGVLLRGLRGTGRHAWWPPISGGQIVQQLSRTDTNPH